MSAVRFTPAVQVQAFVNNELKRFDRLEFFDELDKEPESHIRFVKALDSILKEREQLINYLRLVVKCHANHDFEFNVNAIRSFLEKELGLSEY